MLYRYKNYVYLRVLKNASVTYKMFFKNSGWEEISNSFLYEHDNANLILFGHIQNPDIRHTKGVAQSLFKTKCTKCLDIPNLAPLICSGMFDEHTYPISMIYPSHFHKTRWIPLDLEFNCNPISGNSLTNLFFLENNLPFKINDSDNLHISDIKKKKIQNKIHKIKQKSYEEFSKSLDNVYDTDFKLWKSACDYYTQYIKKLEEENTLLSQEWKKIQSYDK